MNLKQTLSAVTVAGATVMGSIALATSATAAAPTAPAANAVRANAQHWVYYNRYASGWRCALAGDAVYHRNLPGYGYVTSTSCYAAGTGYDLEVLV